MSNWVPTVRSRLLEIIDALQLPMSIKGDKMGTLKGEVEFEERYCPFPITLRVVMGYRDSDAEVVGVLVHVRGDLYLLARHEGPVITVHLLDKSKSDNWASVLAVTSDFALMDEVEEISPVAWEIASMHDSDDFHVWEEVA